MSPSLSESFQLKLPQPLLRLIQSCEVVCVAGCCGVDAFDPDSSHMTTWFRENPNQLVTILDQLSDVLRLVGDQPCEIWSDEYEFNHRWFSANECGTYLREWKALILQAARAGFILVATKNRSLLAHLHGHRPLPGHL